MKDRDPIRAVFDGDPARWRRLSRARIDRARNAPGVRPPAALMPGAWDAERAKGRALPAEERPIRNGVCPCGSGHLRKECHGRPAADVPALR